MKRVFAYWSAVRLIRRVAKGKESVMDLQKLITGVLMSWLRHTLTGLGAIGVVLPADAEVTLAAFVSLLVGLGLSFVEQWVKARKS
jgi:hypothetical protein